LAGVMVSKVDKLNGEVKGSIQLLTQINFNWNGSTDIHGDLYLIGTPVFRGNLIRNNPGYFAERIRAGITAEDPLYVLSPNYFGSNNPAFVSPPGVPTPNPSYTFTIDAGEITGTIYTR